MCNSVEYRGIIFLEGICKKHLFCLLRTDLCFACDITQLEVIIAYIIFINFIFIYFIKEVMENFWPLQILDFSYLFATADFTTSKIVKTDQDQLMQFKAIWKAVFWVDNQ